ncbi:MAG: GDP-mannose 4,6-dehydratase [Gammaproteobacteria bacterium]|nr:GDP-mannose 4,6-dehydratase [Gammaproteobacteria bacterium]
MSKTAIITGITGQDGAYMAQHLLGLGYRVYGTYRRTSSINFWRLEELDLLHHEKFVLKDLDLTDPGNAISLVAECQPDEIYNLAAQSFVEVSFKQPTATAQINSLGTLNVLEAIRIVDRDIRFYQASTSELYGKVQETPQNENTPFYPRSPYAVSKLYAHWITINYRESYDIFATCGILFNHESPLRGKNFVTRKITDGVARIAQGKQNAIELGNLDAKRDWGFAMDYIKGMHAMLQVDKPDSFVLATGRTVSVRSFIEMAFKCVDIDVEWKGSEQNETATNLATGEIVVKVNPQFYRPAEVELLIGDPSKAKSILNWEPTTSLETMTKMMIDSDIQRVITGSSF